MKKESQGQPYYVLNKKESDLLVRWINNAVVTVASTFYGINSVGTASRYSMAQKRFPIPRPNGLLSIINL